jgi:hypothetical protein
MRQWSYYTNVYYKYTHGSFNIDNEFFYYSKIILHNINFVKIIIVRPKNQNWYPKLNVPYFWNNYIISIVILGLKVAQWGSLSVLSPKNNASVNVNV